jgi:DNA-binding FadR family transcriptional regulator
LHGQVVQQLGQMIVSGEAGVDHTLVPDEIGKRFDVSRTVVRESLRVLEAKGLVNARPNVGTRVRPVGDWSLLDPDVVDWRASGPRGEEQQRELDELRWGIEPLAARLAAERGREEAREQLSGVVRLMGCAVDQDDASAFAGSDAEFHSLLAQASGNQVLGYLFGIVSTSLHASGAQFTGCGIPGGPSLAHHVRIAKAVASGDGAAAEGAMRELLTSRRTAVCLPDPRGR